MPEGESPEPPQQKSPSAPPASLDEARAKKMAQDDKNLLDRLVGGDPTAAREAIKRVAPPIELSEEAKAKAWEKIQAKMDEMDKDK